MSYDTKDLRQFDVVLCQNIIKKLQKPIFDQMTLYASYKNTISPNSKSLKQLKELGSVPNLELDKILNGVDRCEK